MAIGLKKGNIVEIQLDNLAHGGDCVGHLDGLAIFVSGGIPGEKVRVKITTSKKSYARGEIVEIMASAKERVKPDCPVFADCGGCQLQQMSYQQQLKHKQQMVTDLLSRIGGIKDFSVNSVLGADYPWNYRNKAQFPLSKDSEGKIVTGFYRKGSHELIVHDECAIQHPLINRIVQKTLVLLNQDQLTVYDEEKHQGLLRHLVVRVGICTNQAILTIVTNNKQFSGRQEIAIRIMELIPELVGVFQNINSARTNVIMGSETELLAGQDYYLDYIGSVKYAISPESFFQVNTLQTEKLYNTIQKFAGLTGTEKVLDAYCGIGSIGLFLAAQAGKVYGIEEVKEAIEDARRNTKLNGFDNCIFATGKVEDRLPVLADQGFKPDLIIFDPPRKGLDERVIEAILDTDQANLKKIIYVSCNPATLARDLSLLKGVYQLEEIQPVDMFPQTHHVETVVLLTRKS